MNHVPDPRNMFDLLESGDIVASRRYEPGADGGVIVLWSGGAIFNVYALTGGDAVEVDVFTNTTAHTRAVAREIAERHLGEAS